MRKIKPRTAYHDSNGNDMQDRSEDDMGKTGEVPPAPTLSIKVNADRDVCGTHVVRQRGDPGTFNSFSISVVTTYADAMPALLKKCRLRDNQRVYPSDS